MIARWKVIRGPGSNSKQFLRLIMSFAATKGLAVEFLDKGTKEASELEDLAVITPTNPDQYPLLVVFQKDGSVGSSAIKPNQETLQELYERHEKPVSA